MRPRPGPPEPFATGAASPPILMIDARVRPFPGNRARLRVRIFSAWLDDARALDWSQGDQTRVRSFAALQLAFRAATML